MYTCMYVYIYRHGFCLNLAMHYTSKLRLSADEVLQRAQRNTFVRLKARQNLAVGECSTRKTWPSSPAGQSGLARHTPSWNRNSGSGDGFPTACTFGGQEHELEHVLASSTAITRRACNLLMSLR